MMLIEITRLHPLGDLVATQIARLIPLATRSPRVLEPASFSPAERIRNSQQLTRFTGDESPPAPLAGVTTAVIDQI